MWEALIMTGKKTMCLAGFFLTSILLTGTVTFASEADEGLYKTIPVHCPQEDSVAFAVDVRETSYPNPSNPNGLNYKTILSTAVEDVNKGAATAEILVAEFIDGIISQDFANVKKFYYSEVPEPNADVIAKMAESWKMFAEIRLTRKWSFGDYRSISLERVRQNGKSDAWSFEVVLNDGRYYMAMDFGEKFNEVLMLFWYMGGEIKNGVNKSNDVSRLNSTLEFSQPDSSKQGMDNKLIVRVNVKYNKFTEDWSEQQSNAENQASDFFCKARKITLDSSDEEFLSLWSSQENLQVWSSGIARPKIDNKLLTDNYADFRRLKTLYEQKFMGQFKQICTIDLGKYAVHYYFRKNEPENLKTIIFMSSGGKYYLSEGLYTNIRYFLRQGMVPKRILEVWQAAK